MYAFGLLLNSVEYKC